MTQKQHHTSSMTSLEKRSIAGLSAIFGLRMLGLFMIFPVFSLAADQYSGATPMLIGLAIGAYGLTQALLQIPFGMLSDRIGRKRVITMGLILFAAGSVVAANADSIYMVIAGRLLQGSGAIAAAIMALTADLTRDEHRTKAMASIGISIGLSFSIALASGAALEHWIGLSGIFWATAVLSLVGIAVLHLWIPTPTRCVNHRDIEPIPQQFKKVLKNPDIMRMVFSIMILHCLLTTSFFALPITLQDYAGLARDQHSLAYVPILILAFISMVPFILIAEKRRKMKPVFLGAIVVLAISQLGWAMLPNSLVAVLVSLWLFFTAFNILEASLPSLMSKLSPLENKGTAMGIYSTAQFIGAFLGGILGGLMYTQFALSGVFIAGVVLTLIWLVVVMPMRPPRHLTNRIIHVDNLSPANADNIAQQINAIEGVVETIVVVEEQVAYVKFVPELINAEALDAFSPQSS
ncbi:MAG: MFS transporter [Gammaproteobacteria bacterium]|nr:MAG: MFS transporter [Gammaproteobacteria bacterium]